MGVSLENIAGEAATAGLGSIMGMMMGNWNDQRQIHQQRELQNMQEAGNKRMLDYTMSKQLEMWKNTSYGAQREQMIKAGINPALMYGMGGGGGQSTGGGGTGVTGAQAPSGGGELGMGIQNAMQLALLKAQKENIEADTANKLGDAANKPKVGTNIEANTANTQANTTLTTVKTELAKIEQEIAGRSKEDAIATIQHNALKVIDEARSALYKANADEATWEMEIEKVKVDLAGMYLRNDATAIGIAKTGAEIQKIAEELVQGWHKLNIDFANANTARKKYELDNWVNDVSNKTKLTVETIKGIAQAILIKGR